MKISSKTFYLKDNRAMRKKVLTLLNVILFAGFAHAGQNPIYENLPTGKYTVGFKIITITDSSRVIAPEYNYLGEKNAGDRFKKITIHVWYPAKANTGKRNITYGEYCYNDLLTSTDETLPAERINSVLSSRRGSVRQWFGDASDELWKQLTDAQLLARANATFLPEKFPLLIGMLRPLSTSITNEMLASNGYVVAMVKSSTLYRAPLGSTEEISDMQHVMAHIVNTFKIDEEKIGTFGFSGSGFSQVLLAMYDYRIKAVADLESGIYMEGLYQLFSASNYYEPSRLKIPFLHAFSRDLSKQEKYFEDFERKTIFSERYHLLLNQPGLHHWDFAAEGYTSCIALKNRGADQSNFQKSFELTNIYLLNFFNAKLKADQNAQMFLTDKPSLSKIPSAIWNIQIRKGVRPAPNGTEFEDIIRSKGIAAAMDIVNSTLINDSTTNLRQWVVLNNLGSNFLLEKKYDESIQVFKLNVQIHPDDANLWDSLAEGYEATGDKENTKKASQQVLDLLNKKPSLTNPEKSLKETAERRLK